MVLIVDSNCRPHRALTELYQRNMGNEPAGRPGTASAGSNFIRWHPSRSLVVIPPSVISAGHRWWAGPPESESVALELRRIA